MDEELNSAPTSDSCDTDHYKAICDFTSQILIQFLPFPSQKSAFFSCWYFSAEIEDEHIRIVDDLSDFVKTFTQDSTVNYQGETDAIATDKTNAWCVKTFSAVRL